MAVNAAPLESADPPWFHWLTGDLRSGDLEQLAGLGISARILDGSRMATVDRLFAEMSARLEFPEYFGANWAALDECLADLEWLHGLAYALVITNAGELLISEPDQLSVLVRVLVGAATEWAQPVALGEDWDRPAVPFHIVLQDSEDGLARLAARLGALGVEPTPVG
jgi:RNAse (barnase) inhibitor barstar